MAAHQASPSLGFSRQEHWSGLPFPSPVHETEKWKWSCSVVSDSSRPHGLQPTRILHPWDFPGKSTGVGCHCLLQVYSIVYHNFKGYIPFVVLKYCLYSLYYTIHPCYLFYTQQFVPLNHLSLSCPISFPLLWVCFLFVIFTSWFYFLDSTYEWYHILDLSHIKPKFPSVQWWPATWLPCR